MINFRYHVVTLVAVFMALGVGVLFGATFIDQNIVTGLEKAQSRLGTRNDSLRSRILRLQAQNASLKGFSASARDRIIRGSLKDRPVILLRFESTPGNVSDAVTSTLRVAGARLDGTLTLSDRLDLRTEDARRRLAGAVGSTAGDARSLSDLMVAQLSSALQGRDPAFLAKLAAAGLATAQLTTPGDRAAGAPPAPPPAVVVLPGKTSPEINSRILVPLVESMATAPLVTAVVEPGTAAVLLKPLRDQPGLRLVTVDSVEDPTGQAALAVGLQAAFAGQFGNYGFGDRATTALPPA